MTTIVAKPLVFATASLESESQGLTILNTLAQNEWQLWTKSRQESCLPGNGLRSTIAPTLGEVNVRELNIETRNSYSDLKLCIF